MYSLLMSITKFVEFRPVPPKTIPILFFFMIFSISLLFSLGLYLSSLQKIIYGEENDLLFPVAVSYMFPAFFLFAFFVISDFIAKKLLRIPKIKKLLIIYEEGPISKREKIYSEMMERRYFTFELIVLCIFIFCSVITFPVHLRINNEGIFYTKIFTFKEKYYEWDKLESVSISYGEQDSSLEMELEFGGYKLSIFGNKGLIPPNFIEVLLAIDLIKQNTSIKIKVEK